MKPGALNLSQIAEMSTISGKMTVAQLAAKYDVPERVIQNALYRYHLPFVSLRQDQIRQMPKNMPKAARRFLSEPEKPKFERPPAVYSNHSPYSIASDYLLGK